MDFVLLGLVIVFFVILLIMVLYLFNLIQQNISFMVSLSDLVQRTFREYYKGQDIDVQVIGNGIDLVWKGDVKGLRNEENNNGFITIYTSDSGVNSPINDIEEADALACKLTTIVYDYIKERGEKL